MKKYYYNILYLLVSAVIIVCGGCSMQSDMESSKLKMEDAVAVKNAMIEYISNSTEGVILDLKNDLILSTPNVDQSGRMSIGMWYYDEKWNVMRNPLPPDKSCGYDYCAKLNRTDGKWVVESISYRELFMKI